MLVCWCRPDLLAAVIVLGVWMVIPNRRVRESEFEPILPTPINVFGGEAHDSKASKPKQRRITRASKRQFMISRGQSLTLSLRVLNG